MSSTIAPTFPLQNGTLVATATQLHIADADSSSKKWLQMGSVTFALLYFALNLYRSLAENQQNPFLITVNVAYFFWGLPRFM